MKTLFILLIASLFVFSACKKSTAPLIDISWGEASHGLQIALSPNALNLCEGQAGEIQLAVQNVTSDSLSLELYATLNLYDSAAVLRYVSYFDISAKDLESLYASSHSHFTSVFKMAANEQKRYRINITRLGWVTPADSRPPYATFYDLVAKNRYTLTCELWLTAGRTVRSNYTICRIN